MCDTDGSGRESYRIGEFVGGHRSEGVGAATTASAKPG